MKIKFVVAATLLGNVLFGNLINAQTTESQPKEEHHNKGHFVIGTNAVNYSTGAVWERSYQSGMLNDSANTKIRVVSAALNLWAGYYVTDRLCLGLGFNNLGSSAVLIGNPGVVSPFPYLTPSNLIFRYYLTTGDDAKAEIYLQGIAGAGYTNSSSAQNSVFEGGIPGIPQNDTYIEINDIFNISMSALLAVQYNLSQHFSLNLGLGGSTGYQSYITPSYSENNGGAVSQVPASKTVASQVSFTGSFGLQYKI